MALADTWGTEMVDEQNSVLDPAEGVGTSYVRGFWMNGGPMAVMLSVEDVEADSLSEAVMSVINEVMDLAEANREAVSLNATVHREALDKQVQEAEEASVTHLADRR